MTGTGQSTHATLSKDTANYDEEWKIVMNTGGEYVLSQLQARTIMQAMATGKREVMFEHYLIAVPYIAEFYRVKRFLRGMAQLPERANEPEYRPIPKEKWEKILKEDYKKIGVKREVARKIR